MTIHSYTITDECDWCEQTKPCRWVYDGDIPVLAICEDCDKPVIETKVLVNNHGDASAQQNAFRNNQEGK